MADLINLVDRLAARLGPVEGQPVPLDGGITNLAVNNEFDEAARQRLLQAYFDESPRRGRRAALRLMMLVSDAREAAWGVVQGSISELDFDFADYAHQHFTRLERNASDPQLEEWMRAATP